MTTPPVVLVAIKGLGIGGAEKLISEAVPFWDRNAFDYRVAYFLPWKDQLVPEIRGQGVEVTMLGSDRGMSLGSAVRLRRHLHDIGASIVHVHSPAVAVLARVASPVPVVYTEHNVASSYREPTRSLNRLTYGRNRAVIAVSTPVAESLAGFPGPRPEVIPNGVSCHVPPPERAAVRKELGVSADQPLIVHVGNIRPHKGHRNLIAATAELVRRRPDALVVSLGVEKHPGDLAALEAESAAAGIAPSIRFLGRRPDARAFLGAADVVVNPSDVEGLPIVVLEAMALGRPIVATAVGGVPDVIEHLNTGLLVPAREPARLAGAVIELLEDRELGMRLGAAAEGRVARDFSLESMVRRVEQVYGGVTRGR